MAIGNVRALCDAMDELALETWQRMEPAFGQPGISYGETSATDNILSALRAKVPGLLAYQSTGSRESETGADWEWWIGEDAVGWLCLRIQAKRAYGRSREYEQLRHAPPGQHGGAAARQYDTLVRGCDPGLGYYPFHVFYNGWPEGTFHRGTHWAVPAQWNACPNFASVFECGHATPRHYGCAIAPTRYVKQLCDSDERGKYSIVKQLELAVPWSYAFGFPAQRHGSERRWDPRIERGNWLDRIHASLQLLDTIGASQTRDAAQHLHEVGIDRAARTFSLPIYVERMRASAPGQFVPRGDDEQELPAAPRTVIVERAESGRMRRSG